MKSLDNRKKLLEPEIHAYILISLFYEKTLATSDDLTIGFGRWLRILPVILQLFGLQPEHWDRINELAAQDEHVQHMLNEERKKYFDYDLHDLMNAFGLTIVWEDWQEQF